MGLNQRTDNSADDGQGADGRPTPRHGRAALLRLATWFEEADPDRADALASAAYALHPALHLEGRTDEGVAATTSWWQADPDRSTVTERPGARRPEPVSDHRAQQARLRDAAESSAHWRRAGAAQIRSLLTEPTRLRARLDLSGAGMEVLMDLLTAALGSGDPSKRSTSAGDLEFALRLHVIAAPGAEVTVCGEGGDLTLEGVRLLVTPYGQHTVEQHVLDRYAAEEDDGDPLGSLPVPTEEETPRKDEEEGPAPGTSPDEEETAESPESSEPSGTSELAELLEALKTPGIPAPPGDPGAPDSPGGPGSSGRSESSGASETREPAGSSGSSGTSEGSVAREVAGTSDSSGAPGIVGTSESTGTHETPGTPDAVGKPEPSALPENLGTAGTAGPSAASNTTGAHEASETPGAPEEPDSSGMPGTFGASGPSEAPRAPGTAGTPEGPEPPGPTETPAESPEPSGDLSDQEDTGPINLPANPHGTRPWE